VLLDDALVCSCLVPAAACDGARVTTVEGVVAPDLAAALAAHGAVQCGFCTPGFVVAATALLDGDEPLDHATAAHGLAGNLCRCTGYQPILAAVLEVDRARRG
jgi:carbon-monoxide dehydrogenase small subunit